MSPSAHRIAPHYVRLSGEIADQAILDHVRACYPGARIAHAFASTEAGVGFAVEDGLAGFPASLLTKHGRSEEHTSELQSLAYLVCRLLLEKKKTLQPRTYLLGNRH